MSYIETMQSRASERFELLHQGVEDVVFTDFPDYSNVGDSAIALGQRAYWRSAGIRVRAAYSAPLLAPRVYDSPYPVVLNGGGSLGGLYGGIGEHRYSLAERLDPSQLLIQEPQSIHFVDSAARDEFARRMAARPNLRLAVRDEPSAAAVAGLIEPILAPDAVHHLGRIPAPEPSQPFVILARADKESAVRMSVANSRDWPADPLDLRVLWWLGWRTKQVPPMKAFLRRSVDAWFGRAERRFARGVNMIAPGEVVITDRLHAMLIALQVGRRVIAIDNATGKLSAYAQAWLQDTDAPLTFVKNFDEAIALAKRG
ncbi:polysaccharide pyruvyl transferase family protein [Microbacterium sp. cf332]|uniref:polysaccharide pyruvyl transferase family protein n=1 Tax=Microbacterium sp. cf332 TaxID=1761804 RepID=UPI000890B6E8|nr:polysaccharide pyruvyl transferase family protein [Microbacterium sp. cf332]SDQ95280.1 Exopolysaccharide biosynthesis protein EpsI, predicted pyruvyl transferase [Microbacterium sp. cf332]